MNPRRQANLAGAPLVARCVAGIALMAVTGSAQFVHPGVFSSQADLDSMRDKINNDPSHPMRMGYHKMLEWTPRASPSPVEVFDASAKWHGNFQPDGHSAYQFALRYVVTGDAAPARKAMEFLDAWSGTLREVRPFTDHHYREQHRLNSAQLLVVWVAAAEIIRHHRGGAAGWPPERARRFEAMLNLFWPVIEFEAPCRRWSTPGCAYTDSPEFTDRDMGRVSNHETSYAAARLAMAVFTDDRRRFDTAREYYRKLLQRYVYPSGQLGETCRDCVHDAMGLVGLIYGAEICWQQGHDVYGERFGGTAPRLLLGMEYKARQAYEPVPRLCNGSASTIGPCSPGPVTGWEIGLRHYQHRQRMAAPWSKKFTEEKMRPEPHRWNFLSWTTATHAGGAAPGDNSAAVPTGINRGNLGEP